jgi:MFS family permease
LQLLNGDTALANEYLAQWAGGIGLAEFAINPALGRLSDLVGRKPFLLVGPVANFVLKLLVAMYPSVRTLMLERTVCGALTTFSGSTSCGAVLSDLRTGKSLAVSGAGLGAYAGIGCLLGPLLGGQILARTGSVRLPFAAASLVALADIRAVLGQFEETLTTPVPWDWQAVNPLRVLKLFQGTSSDFKWLLLLSGLLCFPEGKNVSDFNQLYIFKHVKMSPDMRTAFTVGFGVTMYLGGKLAQQMLGVFGERGHTTVSNVLTAVGFGVWAYKPTVTNMFLGLAIMVGAMERRAATNAMLTKSALESGFARGEFAGLFANFRALVTCVAPLFYSKVYAQSSKSPGWEGAPYYAAGAVTLLGELLHRSFTDEQLGIGK